MADAIAHYRILDHLGSGGLGEVYRARDTKVGRTVAVKVLPPSIAEDPTRFGGLKAAAKRAAQLSHPNIAALFEIGEDRDQRYLVFEYVPGDPLIALVDGRPLNVRRAVELAIQMADALADAEASELVHGDIRPANIVVTSKDRAKLLNFGLSGFTFGGASRLIESRLYVAPEQLAGGRGDIRSDIYSLGAVLYEMLTGQRRGQGKVPSSLNRTVPTELDAIVGRMLAANVEHRYQSAATVAAELRSMAAILEARATAEEAAYQPRKRQHGRRSGWMIAVTIGSILAIAAAAAVWFWGGSAGR